MPGWEDLEPDVRARLRRLQFALTALAQAYAGQVEAAMKRERPWQDRTANARNRLFARASIPQGSPEAGPADFDIVAGHGVEYGVWLELGTRFMRDPPADPTSRGRPSVVPSTGLVGYPIVGPTLERFRPQFFRAAQDLTHRTMSGGG